jgi:hypothetical protein
MNKIKIGKGSHDKILDRIAQIIKLEIYSFDKIKLIRELLESYHASDKQIKKECYT